jgi:hypothetical protein
MAPLKILQIFREQIKPGKDAEYRRIEEDASVICRKMRCPNPYLALTSISGVSETWFVNGYDSSRAMAKVWEEYGQNAALLAELNRITARKAEIVFPAQTLFAHHREDLSQSARWHIGHARFFSITTVQVRPGHNATTALPKGPVVYQVVSGMTDGMFLVITPLRSVEEAGDELQKGPGATSSAAIISSETQLFALNPSMSYSAKEWMAADPEFWAAPNAAARASKKSNR